VSDSSLLNPPIELLNNRSESPTRRCSYQEAVSQVEQLFEKFVRPAVFSSDDSIDLRLGDFRDLVLTLPDNSVDLILTDPPYGRQFRPLWEDLAREAARVLKPGGFFVSYSGQHGFPEILRALAGHLDYFWMGFLLHGTRPRRKEVRVINAAKPLPIFHKPPRRMPYQWFTDVVMGSGPDKRLHLWQEAVGEARYLITSFSRPGDLVLDPFAGTATTLVAAHDEGRRAIGFEVNPRTHDVAARRLVQETGRLRLVS
jgi:site-specific DNA-methyltransferase (adenine-specific)